MCETFDYRSKELAKQSDLAFVQDLLVLAPKSRLLLVREVDTWKGCTLLRGISKKLIHMQ